MVRVPDRSRIDIDAVLLAESADAGSLQALRDKVRGVGQRCGLADMHLTKFVLVVHELAVNAVLHGGGWAEVVVWRNGVGLQCSVTDHGRGIPQRYVNPGPGGSDAEIPRCGLRLVRHICPDIRVDTSSHGTHIEIGYPTSGKA
jgi:anti-sigma regulatory factor (Ser/Thr protein kinase)